MKSANLRTLIHSIALTGCLLLLSSCGGKVKPTIVTVTKPVPCPVALSQIQCPEWPQELEDSARDLADYVDFVEEVKWRFQCRDKGISTRDENWRSCVDTLKALEHDTP